MRFATGGVHSPAVEKGLLEQSLTSNVVVLVGLQGPAFMSGATEQALKNEKLPVEQRPLGGLGCVADRVVGRLVAIHVMVIRAAPLGNGSSWPLSRFRVAAIAQRRTLGFPLGQC